MTRRDIPLAVPNIGAAEEASVLAAVRSGWVSTVGPAVDEFELGIARVSGVEKAAAVAAGTMGLHVALVALGVGRGDLVIGPSYTFAATANAVSHAGATPYFLDIDPRSWTLDPEALTDLLENRTERDADGVLRLAADGRRIGAVMPVYTNGHPADMDTIVPLCRRFGLPVVADAAAAIGSLYKGEPIGRLADLTVYSFNGNKTITTGGGGAVVGPEPALVARVKHLASTARVGSGYDHDEVGFNYRMTNLEAALGNAQLARLDEFVAAKQRIRRAYETAFAGLQGISPFPSSGNVSRADWFFGIVVDPSTGWNVPDLVAALNERGIGVRTFWKPMHLQPAFRDAPRDALPVTEVLWPKVLPLPCSTDLGDGDVARVIETVRGLLETHA